MDAPFEGQVTRHDGTPTSSTGTLMREMVLRGPSQYDCVLIYENMAIDYLYAARDRWGELGWTIPSRTSGTSTLITSSTSPGATPGNGSRRANSSSSSWRPDPEPPWNTGFRPGNPSVSVRFPDSPLIRNSKHGVRIDLPRMCEPPKDEVVQDLLDSFRKIEE